MINNLTNLLLSIRITDVIDIVIVAYIFYALLGMIKETRAQQLFRGVLLIVVVFLASELFDLSLLNWLLTRLITVGLIGVIILFQPEIRRGLEQIGRRGILTSTFRDIGREEIYATVHKLVDAIDDFSSTRTGALIAIERETMLNDIIETGVIVDAEISVRLLGNLFYEGSPLHDGAVIIRGVRIHAASCVLPLTNRASIGKDTEPESVSVKYQMRLSSSFQKRPARYLLRATEHSEDSSISRLWKRCSSISTSRQEMKKKT